MIKIAHTADIHIRGYQYLDEMEFTLDKFCSSIEEKKPDVTVIAGDIYHSKLTVTNEYFSLCFSMLKRLTDISPVIIILGNHDLALNNKDRLDALTPVINSLKHSKHPIHFLKTSQDTVKIGNVRFHCLSILDEKKQWPNKDYLIDKIDSGEYKEDDINVALYHGAINESLYDNDWIARGNQDDLDIFSGFDYAMLGDIHKYQMLSPTIAYPGSLRQNNFGEDLEKGYLFWTIDSKEEYKVNRVILPQKRHFYTLSLDPKKDVPKDLKIKPDSRIKIRLEDKANISDEIKIKEKIRQYYNPSNNIVIETLKQDLNFDIKIDKKTVSLENLRDPNVQKSLIEHYLKLNGIEDRDVIDKVKKLDEKYNSYINQNVNRNCIWKVENLAWENIFSYGKNNVINFNKINGLIGLIGKNASGKSSIIDSFCYGLFNKINKEGAIKSVDFVNSKKKKCKVSIEIDFENRKHKIERSTAKPKTKKGNPANEISFHAEKDGKVFDLNGETKVDTNNLIKDMFGSLEDFNITSLCPQEKLLSFLDARGTDKKKFFSKFLDLEIFSKKYALAEEDSINIKESLKKYTSTDFNTILEDYKDQIAYIQDLLKESEIKKKNLIQDLENINSRIVEKSSNIKEVLIDVDEEELNNSIEKNKKEIDKIKLELNDSLEKEKLYKDILPQLESLNKDYEDINKKIFGLKAVQNAYLEKKNKIKILNEVPCGDQFPTCQFIREAHMAKMELRHFDDKRLDIKEELEENRKEIDKKIKEISSLNLEAKNTEILKVRLENLTLKNDNLEKQKLEFLNKKDFIIANKKNQQLIKELKQQKDDILVQIGSIEKEILNLTKEEGVLTEKISNTKIKKETIEKLRNDYHFYKLYLECMGKNGISYNIISQKLPVINEEVNRILAQVTDFTVDIEDNLELKSVSLFINNKKGKRIIELGSGFEKTMVSLALRAALWNISSLPKTPILILDEPFGFIEDDKFYNVINMLKYLKNYFTHIFIISHDENLKNVMDSHLYVSINDDGFAHCSVN